MYIACELLEGNMREIVGRCQLQCTELHGCEWRN